MTRIFLTGASGFVGTAVVPELLRHGYTLTGLARSHESAAALSSAGVTPIEGDLESLDIIKQAALDADGVIHLGFVNDFANFAKACEIDRNVIATVCEAYHGSDRPHRPVLMSSGSTAPGIKPVTELVQLQKTEFAPRRLSEFLALEWAARGVHIGIVRLPPTTHGEGDLGFSHLLGALAKLHGKAAYVGDGENHWSAVHRDDAAVVYRLALEKNRPGAIYHAIGEPPIKMKDIEAVIAKKLNVPLVSISRDELPAYLDKAPVLFQHILPADVYVTNDITRQELGFEAKGKTLLEDLGEDYYYSEPSPYL